MDCSLPGSSIHGIFQARVLEWGPIAFSEIYTSVQFSSVAQSCPTLCNPTNRSTPGLPVHHQLPECTQTHVHRVSDASQPSHLYHPLLFLPLIFSSIRVFTSESALHIRWSKDWSFSFSISPSSKYSGLISFRIEWFDCQAVQRTRNSHQTKDNSQFQGCACFFSGQLPHSSGLPVFPRRSAEP